MPKYTLSEADGALTVRQLRKADREHQLDAMRTWFLDHYEDPANCLPYETAEGGYQYIWGGPYAASAELQDEFGGVVPDGVIEDLADELNAISYEWSRPPSDSDLDEELLSAVRSNTEYYSNFSASLKTAERMLKGSSRASYREELRLLIFANVVTALETYLSDAFINTVMPDVDLVQKLIETSPHFQQQSIRLSDVIKRARGIEREAQAYLLDFAWHHLARVDRLYASTLGFGLPLSSFGDVLAGIDKRHDVVHRNGRAKDGSPVRLTKEEVAGWIRRVRELVDAIETELAERSLSKALAKAKF